MKNADLKKLEKEYAKKILAGCQSGDTEQDHADRDRLVIEFLREAGFNDIATAADNVEDRHGFWYA